MILLGSMWFIDLFSAESLLDVSRGRGAMALLRMLEFKSWPVILG